MLIRIALKNLLGARLRTILNVFVTSFSFFIILLMSGMYDGMLQHAKNVTIDTEMYRTFFLDWNVVSTLGSIKGETVDICFSFFKSQVLIQSIG